MKILSFSHTICDAAGVANFKSKADPKHAATIISHPAGTVLDMEDGEAQRLVDRGVAVEWVPAEHGNSPSEIAQRMNRRDGQASQSTGVQHA